MLATLFNERTNGDLLKSTDKCQKVPQDEII